MRSLSRWPARTPPLAERLTDRSNRRSIPHRFESIGYVAVSNPNDVGSRWKITGKRHMLYGTTSLSERDRLNAAFKFSGAR